MFNSREIVERLDFDIYRWRQLVRQFLPNDPEAGQRSGRTRLFSGEDIVMIHFADLFLKAHFPAEIVKQIVVTLRSYFEKNNFFPINKWAKGQEPSRTDDNGEPLRTILHVIRTKTGFVINEELDNLKSSGSFWGKETEWQQKKFKIETIDVVPGGENEFLYYVSINLSVELHAFCTIFS